MIGGLMCTASEERTVPAVLFSTERAPQQSITDSKVKWPLCFAFSYVQPISQHTNEEQQEKCLCNQFSHHGKHRRFHLQTYGSHHSTMNCTLGCQQKETEHKGGQK